MTTAPDTDRRGQRRMQAAQHLRTYLTDLTDLDPDQTVLKVTGRAQKVEDLSLFDQHQVLLIAQKRHAELTRARHQAQQDELSRLSEEDTLSLARSWLE